MATGQKAASRPSRTSPTRQPGPCHGWESRAQTVEATHPSHAAGKSQALCNLEAWALGRTASHEAEAGLSNSLVSE